MPKQAMKDLQRFVRRLLPKSGQQYELFDASVLLLVLGGVGYVLTDPPPNTAATLTVLRLVSEEALGWVLTLAAVAGIVTSYTRYLRVGYIAVTWASLAMSGFFALGWLVNSDSSARSLISAVLYGWIGRRLMRDSK